MPAALSNQMATNLNAMLRLNDDITATQNRIATGKAINSASDNIAVYFKAQSYSEKAGFLDTTNQGISQAVKNLDTVNDALTNMKESIKGARQLMADARAKAVTSGTAVNISAGATSYGEKTWVKTGGTATRTVTGAIVDAKDSAKNPTGTLANLNNAAYFQDGDVIRVDLADPVAGTKTVYLKAVAADAAADPVQNGKRGDTVANAIEFNDLASLASGLNQGLGVQNAQFATVKTGSTYQLSMQLSNPAQSITFGQVNDASVGTPASAGEAFDFSALLYNATAARAAKISLTVGSSLDAANAPNSSSYTYSSTVPATQDSTVVDARKQAADFFRQTIYGLDASVKDAYLPGYNNILKGETMSVALNESNTTTQSVKIASAIDLSANPVSSTSAFAVNFRNTSGTISTAYTDTGNTTTQDFLSDTQLDNALKQLDKMTTAIGQYQKALAAAKTAMNARLEFNKTMVKTLNDGANSMTAADTATEAVNLASLLNQQNFASTNMANTKQAEASLIQLLR